MKKIKKEKKNKCKHKWVLEMRYEDLPNTYILVFYCKKCLKVVEKIKMK